MEVRPEPAEVGRARKWARSRLDGAGMGGDESLAQTLLLLVSELVTNAVVHTGRPAVLRMLFPDADAGAGADAAAGAGPGDPAGSGGAGSPAAGGAAGHGSSVPGGAAPGGVAPETVRVEVADRSARPPRRRCAEGEETGGRGLELVAGLADRWGWRSEGSGKAIWCEVDRSAPSPPCRPAAPMRHDKTPVNGHHPGQVLTS
ncbi:ATP-binding protein [Streptomyces sp. PLAI1-29]|uniref:ATP-binding protein n=1 Tax=Streptomyces zingiberis TaxID=2053010 RepID=A0ABX1BWS7_9ACTN|nr:ATP-binding protein [Streptomyces zingiberis]